MKKYFITGLLIWVPLGITLWVLHLLLSAMDQTLLLLPEQFQTEHWLGIHVPGMGVLLTFDVVLGTNRRLRHDATKLIQLGSATTDHYVCIGRSDAPIKSFKQTLTEEWLIGASQPGTSTRDYPAMLNNTTGAKIKQVSGYPGTREVTLAIEKNSEAIADIIQKWIDEHVR